MSNTHQQPPEQPLAATLALVSELMGGVQCGHWIESEEGSGFCMLAPGHTGCCKAPEYEVND